MNRLFVLILLAAAPIVAQDASAPVITATGSAVYGEPMPLGRPIGVGVALAQVDRWQGKTTKFEGRVTQVCQNKGCWLVLADGEHMARVVTGHRFFLPKDTTGRAVVYGALKENVLSESQARHLAVDAGIDSGGIEGEQVEYLIEANSVEIAAADG